MQVLITGATGYIGGAVAEAMQRGGHAVHALSHTDEAAAFVRGRGWTPVVGDLRDATKLEAIAGSFDAIVHAANTGGEDAARADTEATQAFLRGLGNSGKPFVYTSGAWVLGNGASDEDARLNPPALVAWRADLEERIRTAPGVRGIVLRPGIVYGRGAGIPGMVVRGELPIVGTGRQRWPLVHIDDLADLYVRALDAPAGAVLHGISTTITMRDIALLGSAARRGAAAEALSIENARERFGPFADALALDQVISSLRTQAATGWQPRGPSPIEEVLAGS